MRFLFFCLLLFINVNAAEAHPVDRDEPPKPQFNMGDASEPFRSCHDNYWHARRVLNQQIVEYSTCLGRFQVLAAKYYGVDESVFTGNTNITEYWNVVPAHPVIDQWSSSNRVQYCEAQIDAAIATINGNNGFLVACYAGVDFFKFLLGF